ncbi:MAG TPA: response regulator [Albitalea sp.]
MSSPAKVLLVDDRIDNLLALEVQLRGHDVEVLKATSGAEALDLLLAHEVALALVDVQMPEMDGFELAELMRGASRTREIPIIFVTAGLHDRSRVFKGYEAGAVDFLIKPIEPWLLGSKVAVFLQLYAQRRQLAERLDALERANARLSLLSRVAERLLASDDPQAAVQDLCTAVMDHLGCDVFLSFLVEPGVERLRLNASAGLPPEQLPRLQTLDFGEALCPAAARDRQHIVVPDVQEAPDPGADLVRTLGIQAYCAAPMTAQGRLLGTLSFGSRRRARFSDEDVELVRTLADQVATALERVEAQRSLSGANTQLREADRRKNEFIAVLSHELRNPLAPIRNCLYILDKVAPGSEPAQRATATIGRQVSQLTRLVDDLLDVTRLSSNKVQLRPQRLDLTDLLHRTIEDHRGEFEKGDVALQLDLPQAPLWADADPNRIAQAVGNLLQNAAKFTPGPGRVTVSAQPDPEHHEAVVRVTDTGVGIRPEMLERLFQPFAQADTTLDRSQGGLGLGLALVKGLVELHGGSVQAWSDGTGCGTEFTVRLPLAPVPPRDEPAEPAGDAGGRTRVLIIEDNVDAAESLRELLELERHEVTVAYNGRQGLARALEWRPRVVLCDIGLPGIDGYEVARRLRADERLAGLCLVALSGYSLPEDLQRAREAGFNRHMAKPPDLAQLNRLFAELGVVASPVQ